MKTISVFLIGLVFLCGKSAVFGQTGKDSGLWDFIEPNEYTKSAVLIHCNDGDRAWGSGAVVSDKYVITADHIVRGVTSFTVYFCDGQSVSNASTAKSDSTNDVAVLNCAVPDGIPALKICKSLTRCGADVEVMGFGGSDGLRHWKARFGGVGSKVDTDDGIEIDDTGDAFVLSFVIPGDSGGFVINSDGELIAIINGGTIWVERSTFNSSDVRAITSPIRCCSLTPIRKILGMKPPTAPTLEAAK